MQRFFFNHRSDDGQHEIDIEGMQLYSLNQAIDEAVFAVRSAMALADEPATGCFEIEDAGRALVARVPYATDPALPFEASTLAILPAH